MANSWMENVQINLQSSIKYYGDSVSFFVPPYRDCNKFPLIQVLHVFLQEQAFHKKHKTSTLSLKM